MRQIEREWLRRISGYTEGPGEVRRRRRAPGEEDATGKGQVEGEADGGDMLADPVPGEQEPDGEQEARGECQPPAGGEGQEATPGEGDGEEPREGPRTPPGLSVPPEVEAAREEREREKGRERQNLNLAPQAFGLEGRYMRGLAARFARMVSKVAEDSADMPSQGDEEWDLVELRQRRFTGRLVSQCRMTREKRKVAVVLDTSPSCEHQARLFAAIARVAERLGDCELYDAPNFAIHARRLAETWETLPTAEREWQFQRRVVLAFGDFDGIERICAASALRGNRIYWFCCEERPSVMEYNRDFFVKAFKGHYFPATHPESLMKAMRKVR